MIGIKIMDIEFLTVEPTNPIHKIKINEREGEREKKALYDYSFFWIVSVVVVSFFDSFFHKLIRGRFPILFINEPSSSELKERWEIPCIWLYLEAEIFKFLSFNTCQYIIETLICYLHVRKMLIKILWHEVE